MAGPDRLRNLTQFPRFAIKTPDVLNSAGRLAFSIPLVNIGTGVASDLVLTSIRLSPSSRVEPALPLLLGDLAPNNVTAINASFVAGPLTPGNSYLVTVRGTYSANGLTHPLAINTNVLVPTAVAPPVALLSGHVAVAVDEVLGRWSYTLFNDEPAGSSRFINAVSIDMADAFTVTATPPGWGADTDNATYVLWYALDEALPYAHHIAPGAALPGFQIQNVSWRRTSEARGVSITSWNHQTDQADLVIMGTTLVPERS
jgi:hypothetical protein